MGSRGSAVSQQQQRHRVQLLTSRPPPPMSEWSSPPVPNSAWADQNFLLGAGMVVFQPATHKVVVIYERQKKYWFLPKGRKDVGESLEDAALREAYEESGYRVAFMPLYTNTSAPGPPSQRDAPFRLNCEPIFISTVSYPERKRRSTTLPPGEYLSFWYIGQIPADAVCEEGTRMPDEVAYESHLLSPEDALKRLDPLEGRVVHYACTLVEQTQQIFQEQRALGRSASASTSSAPDRPASV
ncbi:hypothetical protein B0H17DRAFT_1049404 [Mycena rosella]|uniref:Nudix hydrolase domain-containing protein n=1 Tax=Mycena rosella TaxID=1033263 RepID=A0AAD7GNI5_MYCRO|nr:hypothetical protein B0H17DRAFT_1049404 [Mycena rosella]